MFRKILVATDGSALSDEAAAAAVEFARATNASMVALSVAESYVTPVLPDGGVVVDTRDLDAAFSQAAQQHAGKVEAAARQAGVPCEAVVRQGYAAHEEITAAAREHGCDLIWMASHGRRGLDRLLLGSVAQKVLTYSSIPVLVYRTAAEAPAR